MPYFPLDWKHSIAIPMAEGVHTVVHAFLKTSEWGEWLVDEEKENDKFVLNFVRGTKLKTDVFMGFGRRLHAPRLTAQNTSPVDVYMWLRVTIRPSPATLKINIFHSAPNLSVYSFKDKQELEELSRQFLHRMKTHITGEITGLCEYLKDCYSLEEIPIIEVIGFEE